MYRIQNRTGNRLTKTLILTDLGLRDGRTDAHDDCDPRLISGQADSGFIFSFVMALRSNITSQIEECRNAY